LEQFAGVGHTVFEIVAQRAQHGFVGARIIGNGKLTGAGSLLFPFLV
jgi:hypothetical protein